MEYSSKPMKKADSPFVKQHQWVDDKDKALDEACVDCLRNNVAVCRHPMRTFDDLDIRVIKEFVQEGLNLEEIAEALHRDEKHMLIKLKDKGVHIVRASKRNRKTARVHGVRQNNTGRNPAYAHHFSGGSNER